MAFWPATFEFCLFIGYISGRNTVCMDKRLLYIALITGSVLFSCKNMPPQNHGPIVLGDSSTIVTETDPQKLKDLVTDLQPVIPVPENKDTTENKPPAADTSKKTTAAAATPAVQPAQA